VARRRARRPLEAAAPLAGALEGAQEGLAVLEARNAGKPIGDARGEMAMVVDTFRYYAGAPERNLGDTIPVAGGVAMTFREPLGVVALITPWNFPLAIASWKLAPALAAGNTVVLKPAELTPLDRAALRAARARGRTPEGVVNVVAGPGSTCGPAARRAPRRRQGRVHGLASVGRSIAAGAAQTIKRVTLELGGKSANVIFADADLERAAAAAPGAVFGNAGQDCCARSRILVQRSAVDEFLGCWRVTCGPCGRRPARRGHGDGPADLRRPPRGVGSYVPEGAPVAIRGRRRTARATGSRPTVLAPVERGDRACARRSSARWRSCCPFDDEAEAVALANDTIYGLSGSIWTRDGARALRVARAVETGVLSINSNTSVRVSTPFGGFKQSGVGRELGPHALEHYTEVKSVYYATTAPGDPPRRARALGGI
jgi:betaine-aldehyde dehydrogenase